jgi:hypothetical protein
MARQLDRVDIDIERGVARAINLHFGNAGDSAQALGYDVFDQFAQLGNWHRVGRDCKLHYGLSVAVGLEDGGWIDIVGQVAGGPAQGVAHVGSGGIEVGAVGKLEGDTALPGG